LLFCILLPLIVLLIALLLLLLLLVWLLILLLFALTPAQRLSPILVKPMLQRLQLLLPRLQSW
jgi:hypothetical protein